MNKYNALVADIQQAIEKFSEIQSGQRDTAWYGASEQDKDFASGSVSAYNNVIATLNLLINKED